MTDMTYSRSDIEGLAAKLEKTSGLSDREQRLLVQIFSAAADRVQVTEKLETTATEATKLHEQLVSAFLPESCVSFLVAPARIGPGDVGSPPPHP